MLNRLLFLLICFVGILEAKTQMLETSDMAHAFTYLEKDTLFVFDLDNTLIEAPQHLGSDQWVTYKLDHCVQNGMSMDQAVDHVIPLWLEIQKKSEMRLIDAAVPGLLEKMQKKNVAMVGLTKRNPILAERTLEQISPLGIDFTKTSPIKEAFTLDDLNGTRYLGGILFTGEGIDKAPVLLAFLKKLKKCPKKIVMIDDKMSYVKNTAQALEPLGIHFVGIRYGAADARVKAFDPKIAELQLKHFVQLLSDEQALLLLGVQEVTASALPSISH